MLHIDIKLKPYFVCFFTIFCFFINSAYAQLPGCDVGTPDLSEYVCDNSIEALSDSYQSLNLRGYSEKYFNTSDNWYFIAPNEGNYELYVWGGSIAGSICVATSSDAGFYSLLTTITDPQDCAPEPTPSPSYPETGISCGSGFSGIGQYICESNIDFVLAVSDYYNLRGIGEKYIQDTNGNWYFIYPSESGYVFAQWGGSLATSICLANGDEAEFFNSLANISDAEHCDNTSPSPFPTESPGEDDNSNCEDDDCSLYDTLVRKKEDFFDCFEEFCSCDDEETANNVRRACRKEATKEMRALKIMKRKFPELSDDQKSDVQDIIRDWRELKKDCR